jgi:hypothetical protein
LALTLRVVCVSRVVQVYVTAVVMEFADAGNLDGLSRTACSRPLELSVVLGLLRQVRHGPCQTHTPIHSRRRHPL